MVGAIRKWFKSLITWDVRTRNDDYPYTDIIPPPEKEDPPVEPVLRLPEKHFNFHLKSNNPPWEEAVMLAFQHTIVSIGTTVMIASLLVPQMGGSHADKAHAIQTLLFTGGINTLLQTLLGSRLPIVMGASSTIFVVAVTSIIKDSQNDIFATEHQRFIHTMRAIQGALIVSSFLNIILGYSFAVEKIARHHKPATFISAICLLGLGKLQNGFPEVGQCIEIGVPTLLLLMFICQKVMCLCFGRGKYMIRHVRENRYRKVEKFGVLLCIGIIWPFAALLTVTGAYNNVSEKTKVSCRVDNSYLISSAPWIKLPCPFQWGKPIFKASHIFGMMGAALVSASESPGTYVATARFSRAIGPTPPELSRSVGLQGVGMLIDGIFGTVAGTVASVENVGLLGLTRVGNRRIVQISSAFMIFFSIFGKFGAFFASIPLPIFAAVYCILYGYITGVGVSFAQFIDTNTAKNTYKVGFMLFITLSVTQFFSNDSSAGRERLKTGQTWINDTFNTIFSSPTVVVMALWPVLRLLGFDSEQIAAMVMMVEPKSEEPPPPPPPPPSPPCPHICSPDPCMGDCPDICTPDPCTGHHPHIIISSIPGPETYPHMYSRDPCAIL